MNNDSHNSFIAAANRSLPSNWTCTRIGEIAQIIRGASPRPKGDPRYFGGSIPWIMISDISREKGKFITQTRETVTEAGAKKSRFLKAGTLILSNSGTVCVPKIMGVDGCIHDGFVAFLNLPKNVHMLFLYYYFDHIRPRVIQENRQGVTQVNLNTSIVREIEFPLPPLNEQHRIVAKIEELFTRLDAGVNNIKRGETQLTRYRQSVLASAFEGTLTEPWRKSRKNKLESGSELLEKISKERQGSLNKKTKRRQSVTALNLPPLPEGWVWISIGDVATFIGSGITPRGGRSTYLSAGIPFIRSQNVWWSGLRLRNSAHISEEQHEVMSRTKLHPCDVLLNITGASIGRSTYVPEDFGEGNVNQHVCIIRTLKSVYYKFLSSFLNSPLGQSEIFSTQLGVTRQGLNYDQIGSLPIPLTGLAEQRQIVSQIESSFGVVNVQKVAERSIKQAHRLKQAILRKAFEGHLVPQNQNDEPASISVARINEEQPRKSNDYALGTGALRQTELGRYVK